MKIIEGGHWARAVSTGVGLWLMAAPAILGYGAPADTLHRIVGPVVASLAIIAIWETTRGLRHLNGAGGIVLVLGPLLLGFGGTEMVNSLVCGVVLIGASRVKGKIEGSYGGGWRALWRSSA